MRYIALISLIFLCSCSSSKKFKSSSSVDSTSVAVHKEAAISTHKENTVSKKNENTTSGKSMVTRNKKVAKSTKETAPVITWVKVDSSASFNGPEEHVTINVKGGKLIGIKGNKVKEIKEDKTDSSTFYDEYLLYVKQQSDSIARADSMARAYNDSMAIELKKRADAKNKSSRSFNWWWLLLIAIAGGCYWLFVTKSGKQWKENAIGWIVSKFV